MRAIPLPAARESTARRSANVAAELARRIRAEEFGSGLLPRVSALAEEYGVSRATVTRALELLEDEGMVAHSVARWSVARHWQRTLDVRLSFGQWALAAGLRPRTLSQARSAGRATVAEARWLLVREESPVYRMRRVRALDDRAVMVERTTYPVTVAAHVSAIPDDVDSIMAELDSRHAIRIAHAEHTFRAMVADAEDAQLLAVAKGSPLLRLIRSTRAQDGTVIAVTDERYLANRFEFSMSAAWSDAPGG